MSDEGPWAICLCPTYQRPALLERSVTMFLAQAYEKKRLLILDDSPKETSLARNEVRWSHPMKGIPGPPQVMHWWVETRVPSLPQKFNMLAETACHNWPGDDTVLVVWEDDDDYSPMHVPTHVRALQKRGADLSKPGHVLSDYHDPSYRVLEQATGRFHASLAFTAGLYRRCGGWPNTDRADFDQQMIARLCMHATKVADPCDFGAPTYTFKWHTGHYHGQNTMASASDETWYSRMPGFIEGGATK